MKQTHIHSLAMGRKRVDLQFALAVPKLEEKGKEHFWWPAVGRAGGFSLAVVFTAPLGFS